MSACGGQIQDIRRSEITFYEVHRCRLCYRIWSEMRSRSCAAITRKDFRLFSLEWNEARWELITRENVKLTKPAWNLHRLHISSQYRTNTPSEICSLLPCTTYMLIYTILRGIDRYYGTWTLDRKVSREVEASTTTHTTMTYTVVNTLSNNQRQEKYHVCCWPCQKTSSKGMVDYYFDQRNGSAKIISMSEVSDKMCLTAVLD